MIRVMPLMMAAVLCAMPGGTADAFEKDVIPTNAGDLEITFIGHGSLALAFGGRVIQVDPYSQLTDYALLPKADIVLITHEHRDHLDLDALAKVQGPGTIVVANPAAASQVSGSRAMKNGDVQTIAGIKIEAVPAYNLVHMRDTGQPFHPKGVGNGYILTFSDKRVYIAGDTENTPEMKALQTIDVAFLPMNLPYTMTPEMVADAVRAFQPKILYPYHFGDTDTAKLTELLKDQTGIEVRIRHMP
jgi:L-ascorbate metabolism protein UlaG (beta-lactamase superfamily)